MSRPFASDGNGRQAAPQPEYDQAAVLGSLLDDDNEEDIPLLYFRSFLDFWTWVKGWAIPGLGMFCEAYFIFSIGNIKPFFSYMYPACYKTHTECSENLTRGADYSQIIGIICGMIGLGFVGDRIGRKLGSVLTVSLMLLGAILLIFTGAGLDGHSFAVWYLVAQYGFGFGVGGEYPMAAGSAAERAEAGGKWKAAKRGLEVVLTFSMQGWGNFINTLVLLILFPAFDTVAPFRTRAANGKVTDSYSFDRLNGLWRTSFAPGIVVLVFMLLATGGSWFLWDFSFYGNKVFQSEFIAILSPGASLFTVLLWTLLNSGCALVGYYFAAFTVDSRYVGRQRIQLFGFLMVGALFFVSAIWYHPLTTPGGIHVFQFIYFFSSFWGQWGPNCTTFLLAGELYPTEMRTSAHGFSAGVAKVGALWASVWFNYLDGRTKFWLTAAFNIGGFVLTLLFMPDSLRVSLTETDRRWAYITSGRMYHGEAVNPKNLSLYERWRGVGKVYARQ
ncbi:hypothetical protein WJX73_010315 [Symbiochloris irregularis]|uniref:Major facilitator superfamily (MFS) profile domain-containing protein n=1 Tax=Symbiochloris irregularis TaxID=706552 RepID=A0AAW1NXC3_9CHLO